MITKGTKSSMGFQMKNKIAVAVFSALVMIFAVNCANGGGGGSNAGGSNCVVTSVGGVNDALNVINPAHNAAAHGTSKHAAGGNILANCSSCHGTNLEGNSNYTLLAANSNTGLDIAGTTPPCCTSCHGVKW